MKTYELGVVLHPDLEVDLKGADKRLSELIGKVGGKVTAVDDWGKQKLAYPIKKQTFGIYRFYTLEIEPSDVVELNQALLLNEEVLRHLLVTEPKRPAPKEEKPKKEAKESAEEKDKEPAKEPVAVKLSGEGK